jgi:PhzF family phenazine biosynthesis protein
MKMPFYQIDAFASKPFEGNQACVMPLERFLPDAQLQAIAAENNVAETAYIVPAGEGIWRLRWFTPAVEVPLCGHATLASAHALFEEEGFAGNIIHFDTEKSGRLSVSRREDGCLQMDFPSAPVQTIAVTEDVEAALGARPIAAWAGAFYAAQFASPEDVKRLNPDQRALKTLGASGGGWARGNFGCFALGGEGVDVTSRFFAPGSGIEEDPATGSWHTMLARILAEDFRRRTARCYQAYPGRGAFIETEFANDRCQLIGRAVTVIRGTFALQAPP